MISVELSKSIEAHGVQVKELELEEPTVKHLKTMDKPVGEMAKLSALIASLAQIPPSSVDQIAAKDLNAISKALKPFLPASPKTGETTSEDSQ